MSNISSDGGGGRGKKSQETQASGSTKRSSASSSVSDVGAQLSGGIREGAREMKEQSANVADSAKELAQQAGEKLRSSVEEQKAAGADYVSGMAGAMRRAANEFNSNVPQAAQYMRFAADQIDSVSDSFRRRDLNQLVADVQGFARRQPTAFLGATVLAGFAAVRFLKTSTAPSSGDSMACSTQEGAGGPFMSGNPTGNSMSQSSADVAAPKTM